VRPNTDKNLESNFKEKQLRETEFCINRIEDLLVSFKNLFKPSEADQFICGPDGNMNNSNSRVASTSFARKSSQTMPKMTNNSNLASFAQPNFSRVSNQFSHNANNVTIPKNTQSANEPNEEGSRFSKN